TGIDVDFRTCGSVRLSAGPDDDRETVSLLAWQQAAGWRVERVDAERLERLTGGRPQPGVPRRIPVPGEGGGDPRRLTKALWKSAESSGVEFRLGESVESFRVSENRCSGVETRSGTVSAGAVVNAAGAWSGAPVRPVRGQIVELTDGGPGLSCP